MLNPKLIARINHYLQMRGLGRLDDPGLLSQFAFLVQDHDHLRSLLVACEPENRGAMYQALAPHLRFTARPLESYLIEAAADAERRQLPIITPDGKLEGYKAPEVKSTADNSGHEATLADSQEQENRSLLLGMPDGRRTVDHAGPSLQEVGHKPEH